MPCGICPETTWQEGLVVQRGVWVSMTRTGPKLDGLTQSCVEQTQRTVNLFTVRMSMCGGDPKRRPSATTQRSYVREWGYMKARDLIHTSQVNKRTSVTARQNVTHMGITTRCDTGLYKNNRKSARCRPGHTHSSAHSVHTQCPLSAHTVHTQCTL